MYLTFFAFCAANPGPRLISVFYAEVMNKVMTAAFVALSLCAAAPVAQAGGYAPAAATAAQPAPLTQNSEILGEFVLRPAVAARLQALVGTAGYGHMLRSMDVQSQLQNDARTLVITGCRQHDCAANGFVLAYDRQYDALRVWRVVDGRVSAANEAGWRGAPLFGDTLQYIRALGE